MRFLVAAVCLLVFPGIVQATTAIDQSHTTWEEAIPINFANSPEQVRFGRLNEDGPLRFYAWEIQSLETLQVTLDVPSDSSPTFAPQVILFQPDTITIGPTLAFEQPPETVGSIYPARTKQTVFEAYTQAQYERRLNQTLELEEPGQYYLAVYLASSTAGNYRLTFKTGSPSFLAAVSEYPNRWWTTQAWAGLSVRTLFLPLSVLGVIVGIWYLVAVRVKKSVPIPTKKK